MRSAWLGRNNGSRRIPLQQRQIARQFFLETREQLNQHTWLLISPSRLNLSECLSQSIFPLVRRCWDWVCDCRHCVEPLTMKRQPVKDVQIRSVGYDRRRGRLEIQFTWTDDVRQFYPIAPAVYRQLLAARPMYLFLNQILNTRRVRFAYVRTEAKRAIMMA